LAGLAVGLALSGALRWGRRRTRSVLIAVGLNLAALALLGAILASGTEPGGLGVRWHAWVAPFAVFTAAGLLAFRFPRAVGLPASWWPWSRSGSPWGPSRSSGP